MISLALPILIALSAAQPRISSREHITELVKQILDSGRVLEIATPPSQRTEPQPMIAPGAPPLVSFRLLEGNMRERFNHLELMMDDAGH